MAERNKKHYGILTFANGHNPESHPNLNSLEFIGEEIKEEDYDRTCLVIGVSNGEDTESNGQVKIIDKLKGTIFRKRSQSYTLAVCIAERGGVNRIFTYKSDSIGGLAKDFEERYPWQEVGIRFVSEIPMEKVDSSEMYPDVTAGQPYDKSRGWYVNDLLEEMRKNHDLDLVESASLPITSIPSLEDQFLLELTNLHINGQDHAS